MGLATANRVSLNATLSRAREASADGVVLLMVANKGAITMVQNLICWLGVWKMAHRAVVMATHRSVCTEVEGLSEPALCVVGVDWVELASLARFGQRSVAVIPPRASESAVHSSERGRTAHFHALAMNKLLFFSRVVRAGHSVLCIDVDVALPRDPRPLLAGAFDGPHDVVGMDDTPVGPARTGDCPLPRHLNSGFFFARANERTSAVLDAAATRLLSGRRSGDGYDQGALNVEIKAARAAGQLSVGYFDCRRAANGNAYFVHPEVGGRAAVVHANYFLAPPRSGSSPAETIGAVKQRCMRTAGLWLVPPPRQRPSERRPACLARCTGTESSAHEGQRAAGSHDPVDMSQHLELTLARGNVHIAGCNATADRGLVGLTLSENRNPQAGAARTRPMPCAP